MNLVLIAGGGFAGCTAATEIARIGGKAIVIEKSDRIGGKARDYGCKATTDCTGCGVCLTGGLWKKVSENPSIRVVTNAIILDVTGSKDNFQVLIEKEGQVEILNGIFSIIAASGFEFPSSKTQASAIDYPLSLKNRIINGSHLEKLLKERSSEGLFPKVPERIGFIQCIGSRNKKQKNYYCSRVCCGYSTRAARVLKHYYPELSITFFYMDLQWMGKPGYAEHLQKMGFDFIRCRPVKISEENGLPCVWYEMPGVKGLNKIVFDYLVLSEGIHPSPDNQMIAELLGLSETSDGFLKYVKEGAKTGIFMAGCVSGPQGLAEVHAAALSVASQALGIG